MASSLRILFCGSGEFGLPALRALREAHEVAGVCTQPDRPAGRGKRLGPTPVAAFAQAHGLPLIKTADVNAETLPAGVDALVVIAFGQYISRRVAGHARLGAINLHASLLPRYRGAAPIHHALINGEPVVGNSVIRLARRMDAGAILGQSRLEVRPAETTGELHDRLAEDGAPLVLRVLADLTAGTAVEVEQEETQATQAPKLSRADAILDFTRPAGEVAARINGLSPWPGCQVRLVEGDVEHGHATLLRARPADGSTPREPSEITDTGLVACGGGTLLEVLELQPRGGKRMPLRAYRNGRPWHAGMRLQPE